MTWTHGGLGKEASPYLVPDADALDDVRDYDGVDIYFRQTANISLTDYHTGAGWTPIVFSGGEYDGDGYEISELYHSSNTTGIGLFGTTNGALKNITLKNVSILGASNIRGALVSLLTSSTASATNCKVDMGSGANSQSAGVAGTIGIGGFAGRITQTASVVNCVVSGTVSAQRQSGGFVGQLADGGTITDSSSHGSITTTSGGGTDGCGGFVGNKQVSSQISGCFSTVAVTAASESCGGFVGKYIGTASSFIRNCYATGSVTNNLATTGMAGGFVGEMPEATGREITNCYSTGAVSAAVEGGFSAFINTSNTTACYWDTETSGLTTSASGTGRLTAEMTHPYDDEASGTQRDTYDGWSFPTVWRNDDVTPAQNNRYPVLAWYYSGVLFNPLFFGGGF